MSCDVGCRHGSDLALLWLWHRLVAVALIQPLAWKLPYAVGATLKTKTKTRTKQTKKPQNKQKKKCIDDHTDPGGSLTSQSAD